MTAHQTPARVPTEQEGGPCNERYPDRTAPEIAADELAAAEAVCREWLPAGRDGTAICRVMAEYDERGRERDAARVRIDAAFSVFEAAGYDLSENDGDLVALVADLAAERDVARAEVDRLREENQRLRQVEASARQLHMWRAEVTRLRALAGAPTADVAALPTRLRIAAEVAAHLGHGSTASSLVDVAEDFEDYLPEPVREAVGRALVAAPEGVDAADEPGANGCGCCGKPLRRCCYTCPDGAHDEACEIPADELDVALDNARTASELDETTLYDTVRVLAAGARDLRGREHFLRPYLIKIANMLGRPTRLPLDNVHDIEHVGEGVLAELERRATVNAELKARPGAMDLGAVGEWTVDELAEVDRVERMAAQLAAAQAANQRVRTVCRVAIATHQPGPAEVARDVLAALDGDTTEEER